MKIRGSYLYLASVSPFKMYNYIYTLESPLLKRKIRVHNEERLAIIKSIKRCI